MVGVLLCDVKVVPVYYFDGLVQERRNSNVSAMELCVSFPNPSACDYEQHAYEMVW